MISVALRLFLAMTLLTGVVYPCVVTLFGLFAWPQLAQGNFIKVGDQIVGSKWIGQKFTQQRYFWGRPSASDYNAMASGGSNLGPSNAQLKKQLDERVKYLLESHPNATSKSIPSDLLYASGSGLDPDISLKSAFFQFERVAKARNLDDAGRQQLKKLIEANAKSRSFRPLSSPYVNVLELNIALEKLQERP